MKSIIITPIILLLCGCSPFVPTRNIADVPKEQLSEAYKVRTATLDNPIPQSIISKYVENITAYSCQFYPSDPPASKGDALLQLKLKALEKGADAIIDLTFDTRGTDPFGTNCWESVQASGVAVKLK